MKLSVIKPYSWLLFAAFFVFYSAMLQAEVYRWVDKNGVTNYSDRPVNGNKRTKEGIEILEFTLPKKTQADDDETEDSGEAPAKKERAELSDLLSDSAIEQILKLKQQEDEVNKCRVLRRQLAALEEKEFATYRDEDGNYRVSWGDDGVYTGKRKYLSRSEINTEATEVKKRIAQACEQPDDDAMQSQVRAEWIRAEHCALSKAVLADLIQADLRSTDQTITEQKSAVERYCAELEPGEHRDDEDYYPKSFPVRERRKSSKKKQ